MTSARQLLDDCFLHDKDRMKHDEVLAIIDAQLSRTVDNETVRLDNAAGRILAGDVFAPRNIPLADNAAVDGYAFAHSDYVSNDAGLSLGALIAAGETHEIELKPGECARIFTGAIMPKGADTIAMQEDCDVAINGMVKVPSGLKRGANRRQAGEDLGAGSRIASSGKVLSPADIAALASAGIGSVEVRKKIRIAVLSTGNELIKSNNEIVAGKIYDANRPMLKALLDAPYLEITDLGITPDDEAVIERTISQAAKKNEIVLTSGSASRGDEDHMLNVLATLGKRHLWQIAIKPGRPMLMGQIGNCVVVGLPGNPVASFVCANLYVYPLIAKLTGAILPKPMGYQLPAGFEIAKKKTDRREFLRGWTEMNETGHLSAVKFDRDGSGLITGLRLATGLIEIPEDVDHVARGDLVRFIPLNEFRLGK